MPLAATLAVLMLGPAAAARPDPPKAADVVEILRADGSAQGILCRGVRMTDGRIVVPMIPMAGVRAARVRAKDGGRDDAIASVTLPQSPFILVLATGEKPAPNELPPAEPQPSIAGLTVNPLPGSTFAPPAASITILRDNRRVEFRTFTTVQSFTSPSLGSVATGQGALAGMLVGPYLAPQPFRTFALLDPLSLRPVETMTPEAWGEATGNETSAALAKAIQSADADAAAKILTQKTEGKQAPARALLAFTLAEFANLDRWADCAAAFDTYPELASVRSVRGIEAGALVTLKRYGTALAIVESGSRATFEDDTARGIALLGSNQPREAEAALRLGVAKEAGNVAGWMSLGTLLAATNRPVEAAACGRSIVTYDHEGAPAMVVANLLASAEKYREAELIWRDLVKVGPDNATFLGGLATTLAWQNRAEEALEIVRGAEARDLKHKSLTMAGLRAAAGQKNLDLFRKYAAALLEGDPDAAAYGDVAQGWQLMDNDAEALKLLDPVAEKFRGDIRIGLLRASSLLRLERMEEAAAAAKRVLEIDPRNTAGRTYLLRASSFKEAEPIGEDLLREQPGNSQILALLVYSAAHDGDQAKAREYLDRLRQLNPEAADGLEKSLKEMLER
jgi:tetratricopeptide (TPR) repeat protein